MIEDNSELIDAALKSEVSLSSSRRLPNYNSNSRQADAFVDDAYRAFELQNEDKKITRKRSDYPTTALTRFTGDRLISMYDESSHDLGFALKSTDYAIPNSPSQHDSLLSSLNNQIITSINSMLPDYLLHNAKSSSTNDSVFKLRSNIINKYIDEFNLLKIKHSLTMTNNVGNGKPLMFSSVNNKLSNETPTTQNAGHSNLYASLINNISELLFVKQFHLNKKYESKKKND